MPYQVKELFIPTEKERSFVGRTSLRKFKGLEAPFVIVSGIPEDDQSLNDASIRDALYIAVTRSLEATIVLAPKSSLAVVRSWLTKT
jgi:superfamily I DNA and RNA helicase